MSGYSDKPILDKESDIFEVKDYVDSLSEFIKICSTPMTIAIQGDWGSGKTSFMNMIKSEIKEEVATAWFNTWQFSQFNMGDQLPVIMMTYFIDMLTDEGEKKNSLLKKVGLFAKGAAKIGATAIAEQTLGGTATENLLGGFEGEAINNARVIADLKREFEEAVKVKLKNENKNRMVVFIDDLDRLQPEKAVELLEILKVFLDIENSIYVLAVDYSVVSQGIKNKFGGNVSVEKGKSFFDKIIQLPFKVPLNQYNVIEYIRSLLKGVGVEVENDDVLFQYEKLIRLSIGRNPRSIKRLFNSFMLINMVAIKKDIFEKKYEQHMKKVLFAILCMQMQYDKLYEYIVEERDSIDEEGVRFFNKLQNVENLKDLLKIEKPVLLMDMAAFVELFNEVIQLDDDLNISPEELAYLQKLLSFSTLTSKSGQVEYNPDKDYMRRRYAKWVANEFNKIIIEKHGDKLEELGILSKIYLARNSKIVYIYTFDKHDKYGYSMYNNSMIRFETTIQVNKKELYMFDTYVLSNEKKGLPIGVTDYDVSSYNKSNEHKYFIQRKKNLDIKTSHKISPYDTAMKYYELIKNDYTEYLNYFK